MSKSGEIYVPNSTVRSLCTTPSFYITTGRKTKHNFQLVFEILRVKAGAQPCKVLLVQDLDSLLKKKKIGFSYFSFFFFLQKKKGFLSILLTFQ